MLNTKLNGLYEVLIQSLETVASANGPHTWQAEGQQSSTSEAFSVPAAESLRVTLVLSGGLSGGLVLSLPRASATLMLGETAEAAASWLALVRSVGERLCPALGPLAGAVTVAHCNLTDAALSVRPLLPAVVLRSYDEHTSVTVEIGADEALLAQLQPKDERSGSTSEDLAAQSAAPLQRVIDVPLFVTLRFGQRQLTLREVLELNTGSLLELDRQVDEPVDLILGDRVIARGEVVLIDGNYGMRVTEVLETSARGTAGKQTAPPLRYATA